MLAFVLAPDPIYKTVCTEVAAVDDTVRATLETMMGMLRAEHAYGLGAPMVGVTRRLAVVEMVDEKGRQHSYKMVNPTIIERSDDSDTQEESSITFLGIAAPVTRPASIVVSYLDEKGAACTIQASGLLARVLQHEIDYLDGRTFLDHQPPMKRDVLRRKMEKAKRIGMRPHVHGPNCAHDH